MKNFHRFAGIDWSGAEKPVQTKSIAVAVCSRGDAAPELLAAPDKYWSRSDVAGWLAAQIEDLRRNEQRILVGIDANCGYAHAVGVRQLGQNYKAQDLWAAVERCSADTPNYFAGGFWTHADFQQDFWLSGKRPEGFDMPRRVIETVCGEAGYGWPESPFKLLGPKQVGKGGLAAMRLAHDLKQRFGDDLCVWPFEAEITNDAVMVISEIYPRQFLRRAGHGNAKVKTLEDLNKALAHFGVEPFEAHSVSDHDTDALLSAAGLRSLCGNGEVVPQRFSNPAKMTETAKRCEGWIFGVD